VLEQIAQSLNRAGWEVEPRDLNSTRAARLEARQGEARVTIFPKFRTHTLLDEESSDPRRFEYIVCHRKPLSRTERAQALELLLDRKPWDFETLLPFVHSFEVEQRRRFFERLAQTGSSSPKGCVQLADLYLDQGRTNDARHQLLKAHALSATRPESKTLKRHIEDLAGKIQPQSRLELEYTPEICRELGFIEIEKVTQPMEFTRGFGEPLAFFVRISNPVEPPHTAIRIVALTVRAPMNGICSVEHRSAEKGMHGFGNGAFSRLKSGFQEQTLGGVRKVIVRSEALPDSVGAKFTVRPEPNAEVTP
jgi:hypothetical protein